MKISVDGKEVLELSEVQKKVIMNDISSADFQADMERRVCYILEHKYEQCLKRLKTEWEPKLQSRVASVPTSEEEYANLVFSQPDYKDRAAKQAEEAASRRP